MTQSMERKEISGSSRSRRGLGRLVSAVISAVRVACGVFAAILVAQIVFVFFAANPDKWITRAVAGWSDDLTLGLRNLFTPADPMLGAALNYGIAAIAWLVIGAILVRIMRRAFGRWSR